jgi:hypothetical protein
MQSRGVHVLGPSDGRAGLLGSMGVRFMLASGDIRSRRERSPRRFTGTAARTSTPSFSRDDSARS